MELEIAIGPPGGDRGEPERARAEAAEFASRGEGVADEIEVLRDRPAVRAADLDQRRGVARAAHPDPLAVEESAAATSGGEHLVGGGIVDDAELYLAGGEEGERHAPHVEAMDEIEGAVDRIDDPKALACNLAVGSG